MDANDDDDDDANDSRSSNWYANNRILEIPTSDCRVKLQAAWHRAVLGGFASTTTSSSSSSSSSQQQSQIIDAWFTRLWQLHTQPDRHYHTVMHLYEMLGYLELIVMESSRTSNPMLLNLSDAEHQAVLLAIFFHDAIYDTTTTTATSSASANNEAKSANLFQEEFCRDMLQQPQQQPQPIPTLLQQAVVNLILATASHDMPADGQQEQLSDKNQNPYVSVKSMALFLDLDMAVLGKTTNAYNHYASLIRKEYHTVPHDIYCSKRAAILETFLGKAAAIFHTNYFRQTLEARARENLQREIDLLKQNKIPSQNDE